MFYSCITFQTINGLLTILVAITIGGSTVYIAIQQFKLNQRDHEVKERELELNKEEHKLNERKLKLDLFDKRFKVVYNIKNFIHALLTNEIKIIDDIHAFKFSILENAFLFDSDTNKYIDEIIDKSYKLHFNNKTANDKILNVHSEAYKKELEEGSALWKWLRTEQENIESKFMKYLDFRNL
jgi:hypothetical protein